MNRDIRRLLRCADGAVAVEMALVSPLLLLLIFGIYDFGSLFVNAMEVEHATQAAASYAFNQFVQNGSAPSLSQINTTIETQSLPITVTIGADSARPALTWTGCPTATSVQTTSGACAAGLGTYLSIVGSAPMQSMLGSWVGFPTTLATKIMIRLQ